jgi:hypothetical protein
MSARRMFKNERLDRVQKAGGSLAPLLAVRTSRPEGLGAVRKHRAGLGGDPIEGVPEGAALAGLQPEAWFTIDHAARLCAAMEEAIIHDQIGVMAELVEESVEVAKAMTVLEGQMGRDSHLGRTSAAVNVMSGQEKALLEARKHIEQREEREHLWGGVVEKYKFSPAHNAVVVVVDLEGEKHAYPIDDVTTTPEVGSRVHAHRRGKEIEIEDLGRPSRNLGRERVA